MNTPATPAKGYRLDVIVISLLALAFPLFVDIAVKFLGSLGILNNAAQAEWLSALSSFPAICGLSYLFASSLVPRWTGAHTETSSKAGLETKPGISEKDRSSFRFDLFWILFLGQFLGGWWLSLFQSVFLDHWDFYRGFFQGVSACVYCIAMVGLPVLVYGLYVQRFCLILNSKERDGDYSQELALHKENQI